MIVARFCNDSGKPIVARGTCRIDGYAAKKPGGDNEGWFPIESFSFGFEDKTKAKTPAKPGVAPEPKGEKKSVEEEPKDFASVSIKKLVDATSLSLMMLVMEERETGEGGLDKTPIEVDIHVISTVDFKFKKNQERSTFTSVLVHLEAVSVLSWKIDGSGDTRPSETVSVKYDRAAMIYNEVTLVDGLPQIQQYGPKGWDQKECEQYKGKFRWDLRDYKDYLPPR